MSGLEHEIEAQKEDYEKKLTELSSRLESIENGMKSAEEREEEKGNSEKAQLEELDKFKEEMGAKFADVCTKVWIYLISLHFVPFDDFLLLLIWLLFFKIVFDPLFPDRLSHCRKISKTPMRQVRLNSERWTMF